jgi:hypothetical protein
LEIGELRNTGIAKAIWCWLLLIAKKNQVKIIFKEVYLQKRPPERRNYSFIITKP